MVRYVFIDVSDESFAFFVVIIVGYLNTFSRSQWPRRLRRRSLSPTEIVGSNPTEAWTSVVSVVCCQVEVSGTS